MKTQNLKKHNSRYNNRISSSTEQHFFELSLSAHISCFTVSLQHESRHPFEKTVHFLLDLCRGNFSYVGLVLFKLYFTVALDLNDGSLTLRVNSYSLSLCFQTFMQIPAIKIFLARYTSSCEISCLSKDISLKVTLTTS